MKPSLKQVSVVALAIAALGYVASTHIVTTHAYTGATVTTDSKKYSEGQTMLLSGSGFTAFAAVNISVLRPDQLTDYLTAVADTSGSFQASYTPSAPAVLGRYKITASDGTNSATTASTEADASFSSDQCAQNDSANGKPLGLGYCNWIGSALGSNNSTLYEAIATEQQVLITGIDNSTSTTHTLVVGIEATKGGLHTYDWLVSDAQASGLVGDSTENSEKASALAQINLQLNRCGNSLAATDKSACSALVNHATTSNTVDIVVPGDPFVSQAGGLTQTKIDNYENGVPSSTCKYCGFGTRTVRLYTDAPVSGATMALEHRAGKLSGTFGDGATLANGGDTGDSYIWYRITWTGSASSAMLVGGADIAYGGDGTGRSWPAGTGASNTSGDPYHFFLVAFDGSGGSLDNQMSASAVNPIPTKLTLHKIVVTDNGGTALPTAWTLSATGPTNISGVDGAAAVTGATVTPGTYTLSESGGPTGYTPSQYSCVVDGGTPVVANSVTLGAGDSAVCTITNDDIAPTLTLVKNVVNDNGGTSLASAWTLSATGTGGFSGNNGTLSNNSLTQTLGPKTVNANVPYALSESGPTGYAASAWTCVGGAQSGSNITLAAGGNATCTITNNDKAPSLTLDKIINFTHGGTLHESDWTLTADDGTPADKLSGPGAATHTDVVSGATFKAGTYTLSESAAPAGYTNGTGFNCSGTKADGTTPISLTNVTSITLANGDTAVCAITNTDKATSLTLDKIINFTHGGTLHESDWTLTADDGTPADKLSGPGAATHTDVVSGATFKAGTYTLSESAAPAGYTNGTGFNCSGTKADGTTPISLTNVTSITLANGDSAVCSITNNDKAPSLTLDKIINFTHGGTLHESDWTLTANGGTAGTLSGPGAAGSTDVVSGTGFKAGTYALSESAAPAGYTNGTGFNCSGTKADGTTAISLTNVTSITLANGDTAVCAITNTDKATSLTLDKIINFTHGGTLHESDWTLTANGGTAGTLSGPGAAGSTDVVSGTGFKAGTYALSESAAPAGYTNGTGFNCSGTKADGTTPISLTNVTSITLAQGDSAVCSITNTDKAPSLTVVKKVINDNGGTAAVGAFGLSSTAGTLAFGTGVAAGTTTTYTATQLTGLTAGTPYSLHENTLTGYTEGIWSCTGTSGLSNANAQNGSVTLALGDSATCTITNDDQPAALALVKAVNSTHGGTATAANFPLSALGATGTAAASTSLSGVLSSLTAHSVNAGVYALSETNNAYGYTLQSLVCTGFSNGGSQLLSQVTLKVGETVTCTFTNVDVGGTIIIQKNADPATGSFAFDTITTGSPYPGFTLTGSTASAGNIKTVSGLSIGTYTAHESTQLGWVLTGIGGDSTNPFNCIVTGSGHSTGSGNLATATATISLQNGDTVKCVFENTATGGGVTRTQGFWATHPQLTNIAWFGGTAFGHTFPGVAAVGGIGDITLCGRTLADVVGPPPSGIEIVDGGFWSGISQTSTGKKRSSLDQARMQLLQQLLAAELNASAFGSTPSSGSFSAWESAYCGTSTSAIQTAQQQAGSFNSKGDSSTFTPGTSADSKDAKANANYTFWDILP